MLRDSSVDQERQPATDASQSGDHQSAGYIVREPLVQYFATSMKTMKMII